MEGYLESPEVQVSLLLGVQVAGAAVAARNNTIAAVIKLFCVIPSS
jgi:hypothetical protein